MSYKYIYQQHQLEPVIRDIVSKPVWGLDTETNGLDPHTNKVILMQIGRKDVAYVIDTRSVNIEPLRECFLENKDIIKVGHNIKFDYKMIRGNYGYYIENIRDTFIGEKLLSAGLLHYMTKEHKYDACVRRRVVDDNGKPVILEDKERLQKSFINHVGPFSSEQLQYAADDVLYIIQLLESIQKDLRREGLDKTFFLECRVLPAFGDMEFEGMKLNTTEWRKIYDQNIVDQIAVQAELDEITKEHLGGDLFGNATINYGSVKQVVGLMQKMGLKVKEYDRETKREYEHVVNKSDDATLKKLKDVPFVKLLRTWRGYEKKITSYGLSYIDAVHPLTGCIHPNLWQLGTQTGRPAAGESDINPLNVPREQRYRSCFNCEPDEVVETDDFSGCESRILAHISQDPKLIDIFKKGEDIHCSVATMLYGVEVTKKNENKKLRTPAKALNFGW